MPLQTITGGGSFTRQNISQLNNNFAALSQPDLWVRPQAGVNASGDGSYEKPYATMAGAFGSSKFAPGVVIGLLGVLLEEFSTPNVNDVTIRGMGNQPRQATTSSVANGGGATWLSPSGGTGHLLTVNGQGFVIENIFFNNSAAAGADILLTNTGDGPALANAEHTIINNCIFTGAIYGVRATGLPNWVTITNNKFFGFNSTGDTALSSITGAGTGTTTGWVITGNHFLGNDIHMSCAGLTGAWIKDNHFSYIWGGKTTVTQVDLTGGANNTAAWNFFDVPETTTGLAAMFVLGTNDRWYFNMLSSAQTTTIFVFGGPQTS